MVLKPFLVHRWKPERENNVEGVANELFSIIPILRIGDADGGFGVLLLEVGDHRVDDLVQLREAQPSADMELA